MPVLPTAVKVARVDLPCPITWSSFIDIKRGRQVSGVSTHPTTVTVLTVLLLLHVVTFLCYTSMLEVVFMVIFNIINFVRNLTKFAILLKSCYTWMPLFSCYLVFDSTFKKSLFHYNTIALYRLADFNIS